MNRPIDGYRLKKAVMDRNHTLNTAGEAIYRSPACLYQAIKRGYVSDNVADALNNILGIKYDQYKPAEKPAPQTKVVSKDELQDKMILQLVTQIANNQNVILEKLNNIEQMMKGAENGKLENR